jgi:alkylated DNA repair dioxygenase AlkB
MPRLPRPPRPRDAARRAARDICRRTPVHAANAEVRPAIHGAHVELRTARLGLRWNRLSLSAYAPGHRATLAADARCIAGNVERSRRLSSAAASMPHQFLHPGGENGPAQDRDEQDFDAPVLSLSLGDTCLFRVGGSQRNDPTRSFRLSSGDALLLGGGYRLAFHGVDRIEPGTSTLLAEGGRINLTLRRVTRPATESARPHPAAAEAPHDYR